MKANLLPPNITNKISADERKRLGVVTQEESNNAIYLKVERKMHHQFASWLRIHERGPIPFIHAAPNKKSTIRKGWPDFTVLYGNKVCCIEFKTDDGVQSKDQVECCADLNRVGTPCYLCRSVDVAIEITRLVLGL